MTREPPFLKRAILELDAASALKDWNPEHFLDTAEMAFAVATGYDWLYQDLTPDQRRRYGSNYHIFLLAASEQLGFNDPLPDVWQGSGNFMVHVVGPTRIPFNFADAGAGRDEPSPAQSWLSRKFADAGQARHVRSMLRRALAEGTDTSLHGVERHFPLHLLWLPSEPSDDWPDGPLAASFSGKQPVAMFRSSWKPDAAYLAIKGGTAHVSHGQMDVGSFVYDAGGVRWFHDMGADNSLHPPAERIRTVASESCISPPRPRWD